MRLKKIASALSTFGFSLAGLLALPSASFSAEKNEPLPAETKLMVKDVPPINATFIVTPTKKEQAQNQKTLTIKTISPPTMMSTVPTAVPSAPPRLSPLYPTAAPPYAPSVPLKPIEPSDLVLRVKPSQDGKTLFISGDFTNGTYTKVSRVLKSNPNVKSIALTSSGGIVFEGLLLNHAIRDKKLNTYASSLCASACTIAFLGGSERVAMSKAQIGFHRSRLDGVASIFTTPKTIESAESAGDAIIRSTYVNAGVATAFIKKALSTPSSSMWYPNEIELAAAGVTTRKAIGDEINTPYELGQNRVQLEKVMMADAFWRETAKHAPIQFVESVNAAWRSLNYGSTEKIAIQNARFQLTGQLLKKVNSFSDDVVDNYVIHISNLTNLKKEKFSNYCFASLSQTSMYMNESIPLELSTGDAITLSMIKTPAIPAAMTRDEAYAVAMGFKARMVVQEKITQTEIDARTCPVTQSIFKELALLPKLERTKTMRALLIIDLGLML